MDVGDITEQVFNEGEDILQKVVNEVWMMQMLIFFRCMDGLGNESLAVIAEVE